MTTVQPILGVVPTPPNFAVPAGACDCHTHIFGDPEKFPFFPGRVYTPEPASPEEMAALHKALHIERVVIVTPSVYGPDNSATLFGIKARGATARGVAVIDGKTPDSDLDAMNQAGIRGIRLNLATSGVSDPAVGRARFQAAVDRIIEEYTKAKIERKRQFNKRESKRHMENRRELKRGGGGPVEAAVPPVHPNPTGSGPSRHRVGSPDSKNRPERTTKITGPANNGSCSNSSTSD